MPFQVPPDAAPLTGVRLLTTNEGSWKAKRHLIAHAQRTLDLTYFILEVDGTTSRLMLDLIDAAARGVQVRLLVDYFVTFQQAPLLRTLAGVPNLQVRRYGLPTPTWLAALDAAGIDRQGFVMGLLAADGRAMAGAMAHNTLFGAAVADEVRALQPQPGASALAFPLQVLGAMQPGPEGAAGVELPSLPAAGRTAALQKVALLIQVLRGLKQFLHRNHHKLLLADGCRFLMGGRNLSDQYHRARPVGRHPFQDTDVLAHDPRAGGSPHARAFQTLWDSAADVATPDPLDPRPPMPMQELQRAAATAPAHAAGAPLRAGLKLPDLHARFVDNLPADKGDTAITRAYIEEIRRLAAQRSGGAVDIVSAYACLLDSGADSPSLFELRNTFVEAAQAGLVVNLYTNSLDSTDLKPVNRAAYPMLVPLIEAGVNVFELAPGQGSLHTKAASIGDHCLMVGSYNMDPRSELYDTNNLAVLHDASGAATEAFRRTRIRALKWNRLTAAAARQQAGGARAAMAGTSRITNALL